MPVMTATGAPVLDGTEGVAEGMRSVAGSVVSQHFPHGDAAVGEPSVGASPEHCGGLFAFIGQQFGVGQPRVCVDRSVQEAIARRGLPYFVMTAPLLSAWRLALPIVRPNMRQPPPTGILPSFLASTCTSSPARVVSMRRITRPVGRSSQDSLAIP